MKMPATNLPYASNAQHPRLWIGVRGAAIALSILLLLVTLADASPQTHPVVRAPRLASPPQIDAVLSEWTGIPPTVLTKARDVTYSGWRGPTDLAATFRLAWDDLHLYFAAQVTDDRHCPHGDSRNLAAMFTADCIQLAFDLGLERSTSGYDYNDYEIGLGDTVQGPRVFRWQAGSAGLLSGVVPEIELAIVRGGDVTTYEAAIPWQQLLPFAPGQQDRLGFAVVFMDNDGIGLEGHADWAGGIAGSKNPSLFGTLELLPGGATGELLAWINGPTRLTGENRVPVTLSVWSPHALAVEAELSVVDAGREVFSRSCKTELQPGTTAVNFIWPAEQAPVGTLQLTGVLRAGDKLLAEATLSVTKYDPQAIREGLARVEEKVQRLGEQLERARALGRQAAYPEVSAATVEINLPQARDYLQCEQYDKAEAFVTDLEEIVDHGLEEVTALIADPEKDLVVPRTATSPREIRDGTFYVGEQPVLYLGPMGWWSLYEQVDWLARLGFNCLSLSIMSPTAVFPEPETPDAFARTDSVLWATAAADKHGLVMGLMLDNHLPPWAREQGIVECGGRPWQEFVRRYYGLITQRARQHTNFAFYTIWGESALGPSDTPLGRTAFAWWLYRKHLSVDRLNQAWGSDFHSFEAAAEVLADPDMDNPGIYYDVASFRQDYSAQQTGWCSQLLHELHPDCYTLVYPSVLMFDEPSDFPRMRTDLELLCQACDLNGADTTWSLSSSRYATGTILWREVLLQDLLKSLNPTQPNFDPELHLVNYKVDYSEAYVRSVLLQAYLHGLAGAYIWVWERGEGWDTQLLDAPHVLHACGRTALDLQRLASRIIPFSQAPAEVAIFYSRTSQAYSSTSFDELNRSYEAIFFTDAPVDFVTERQAAAGKLSQYKLVICPATAQVPERTYRAFRRYVQEGGSLLLTGECFTQDEYRRPREVVLPGDVLQLPVGGSAQEWWRLLEPKLTELTVTREVRVCGQRGQPVWGIECRSVRLADGRLLCYVYNMSKEPQKVRLKGAPTRVVNLLTNQAVSFPRQMQPLEFVLFETSAD